MQAPHTARSFLLGLESLLYFFIPSLFFVGHYVRRLYWDGRPGGTVTGSVARAVLHHCLFLHVTVQQDWEARSEYTRTLAVALLNWQPYFTALPGCCFVEEACEALLSRMVNRRRSHNNIVSFDGLFQLFVSLPSTHSRARATGGALRQPMVQVIHSRLLRMINNLDTLPFARLKSVKEARWEPSLPVSSGMPPRPAEVSDEQMQRVLQGALVSLSQGAGPSTDLSALLNQHIPSTTPDHRVAEEAVHSQVRTWARDRSQRMAAARRQLGSQPPSARDQATSSAPSVPQPHAPQAGADALDIWEPGPDSDLPPSPRGSDGQSLYMPPPSRGALSDGYESSSQSSDGLGSLGDLVGGEQANWTDIYSI